jgi:hypothetical protein
VAAASVLALAGCGGSSGPSKPQYIAKADTICTATQTQTAPLIHQIAAAGLRPPSGCRPCATAGPALATPYSVLITLASAKSPCVRPPAACVESVIRSRL